MSSMIVVADSTRARFFTAASANSDLIEVETLTNTEARLHDRDITSDLPGKSTGNGSGGHAYQGKTDPKKYEVSRFAKRIADHLDATRNSNKLPRVLLVADPAFLGELRNHLSSATSEKVVFELDKNLAQQSPEVIRKHLPEFLTH
ncbi:MAG: host attachment protein [Gammaproteobacteria bacterium]|nr:host attachment protein [Gammaproteobacteria bacterium]